MFFFLSVIIPEKFYKKIRFFQNFEHRPIDVMEVSARSLTHLFVQSVKKQGGDVQFSFVVCICVRYFPRREAPRPKWPAGPKSISAGRRPASVETTFFFELKDFQQTIPTQNFTASISIPPKYPLRALLHGVNLKLLF